MTAPLYTLAWFAALTLVCGGAAAFMAGRAVANAWRAVAVLPFVALPLAGAVRFLHYALAWESTDGVQAILSFALMLAFAFLGFSMRRRAQMARQYPWLATKARLS